MDAQKLLRFLQATPAQQTAINKILAGEPHSPSVELGPLLLGMSAAAKLLGVSRPTLWRMVKAGRLRKVEILPGSFRIRRSDLEGLLK